VNTHDSLSDRDAGPAPQSSKPVPERAMNDGKSKENFRARRLSLADTDPAELAKAAANMNVTPDKAGGSAAPARMRQRRMSQSPEMGQKPKEIMPFPTDLVGTYSCHGVEPGHRVGEAQAKINQDRGCVVSPFAEPDDGSYRQALFCVYDGHGAQGDKASHFTMMKVQELLEKHLAEGKSEEDALKLSFTETDGLLKKDRSIDAELSGTTAVVMLFRKTGEKTEAWLAWVGDSRAIVAKPSGTSYVAPSFASNFNLTEDQKPDTPAEMARIKKAGGFVSPPEEEWGGPARVWLDAEMTLPGLAMARSIGDHLVKTVGVTAEPEVKKYDISDAAGGFIVLASDGVWEFIESKSAVGLVGKFIGTDGRATTAVTKLIETAAAKWRQEEGDYRDDITAICIVLSPTLFDGEGSK